MNTLKEIIKYYREKKNISKSKLAQEIGISPSYITRLENGEKDSPSVELLIKLANTLDIPLDKLSGYINYEDFEEIKNKLVNEKGETSKEKIIINHILNKIHEIQSTGGWTGADEEIILNELAWLKNKPTSVEILKEYILSKDYDTSKLNDAQLKDIDKKFTDILELEFFKLNK